MDEKSYRGVLMEPKFYKGQIALYKGTKVWIMSRIAIREEMRYEYKIESRYSFSEPVPDHPVREEELENLPWLTLQDLVDQAKEEGFELSKCRLWPEVWSVGSVFDTQGTYAVFDCRSGFVHDGCNLIIGNRDRRRSVE